MSHPFKRNAAAHRSTLARDEAEDAIEVSEGDQDSDWALWEDSVQQYESGAVPVDPFERVNRRDR